MKNPREVFRDFCKVAVKAEHRVIGKVALGSHLSYYGLVYMEAHGTYRYAAGVVGVLMVLEALAGHDGPPGPPGAPV